MPLGRVSEDVVFLRRLIARIEGGAEQEGRARSVELLCKRESDRLPLGPQSFWLDAALGGGVRRGSVYEILSGGPGDQIAACGFALGLAIRFAHARQGVLIWVVEDLCAREWGAPYGPGLLAWGLDPARLILVRAADEQSALWALEEALKRQSCAAVVGELWSTRRYGEVPARRLALAAREGGVPCILTHMSTNCAVVSHGAQARLAVFAAPDPELRATRAPALPGLPRFAVQVRRTRIEGGRATPVDPDARALLAWRPEKGRFEDSPACRPARRPSANESRTRGWSRA